MERFWIIIFKDAPETSGLLLVVILFLYVCFLPVLIPLHIAQKVFGENIFGSLIGWALAALVLYSLMMA